MSVTKLLSRIVAPSDDANVKKGHDHTYGITGCVENSLLFDCLSDFSLIFMLFPTVIL